MTDPRWNDLATAVRRRRDQMKLRQSDLEQRGGPGPGTVRNIEQATRTKYSPRTFVQLEQSLEWGPGVVDRILDGTVTQEDLEAHVVTAPSGVLPMPSADLHGTVTGSASAQLGGIEASAVGGRGADPGKATVTLAAELLQRMESGSEEMTDRVVAAIHALAAALPDLSRRPPS